MLEHFKDGGWGMFPTAGFGLVMLAFAFLYAVKPERRFLPACASLGALTLLAGALGTVTGFIKTCGAIQFVDADTRWIWLLGLGESLNCAGLALVMTVTATVAIVIGNVRIAFDSKLRTAAAL
jgi:hypothetical protein